MKKIICIFFIFSISSFSGYYKYYEEWHNVTVETACYDSVIYKGSSYKNDKIRICVRSYSGFLDIILVGKYAFLNNKLEMKFDENEPQVIELKKSNESTQLFFKTSDISYIVSNMKTKKALYIKNYDTIYKISLLGFSKDFSKIKNSEALLNETY